jgi:hypothetical protein
MACQIEIFPVVKAFTNTAGEIVSILVSGKASGCSTVTIEIICNQTSVTDAAPVLNGLWTKVISAQGGVQLRPFVCNCENVVAIVVNANNGECSRVIQGVMSCEGLSQCPTVYSDIDYIDANQPCKNGKRTVTGSLVVVPNAARPVGITVLLEGTGQVGSHAPSGTIYSVPISGDAAPGKPLLSWEFSDPSCPGSGQKVPVPPCAGCPQVEHSTTDGECNGENRQVTVSVTIPDIGVPVSAVLRRDANVLDQKTGATGTVTLTGIDSFAAGKIGTVTLEMSDPPGCLFAPIIFPVTPCPGQPTHSDPSEGDGSPWCLLGRIAVVLLFAAAICLTLLALCIPPPANATIIVAAGAAWLVAAVALAVWYALCGNGCGALLVTWESALFGAWLAAYMVTCCPTATVAVIGLAALAAVLFIAWVTSKNCQPTACRVFAELMWVSAVPVATMFSYVGKVFPCGVVSGVQAANEAVVAALATLLVAYCPKL